MFEFQEKTMAHLTPKENLMRCLKGDIPEWVPSYSYYGPLPGVDEEPPNMGFMSSAVPFGKMGPDGSFTDMWGVPYESVASVGGYSLPKPNTYILKDIRQWRDVIKAPDISNVDWAAAVKADMEKLPYSRDRVSLWFGPGGGYFQNLMGFMGFTEGLCAMYEEPEEVKALFAYLHEFYMTVEANLFDLVNPDVLSMGDDSAAERAPFVSPEMFREFLLPLYDDLARPARNRGIPINFHNCGKCGVYFDDLVRSGITSWEPVQLSNDILDIQSRHGRCLVIGGGWEGRGRLTELDVTDEEIRESVRVSMNTYAKNGGYMFAAASTPGAINDTRTTHWNEVLQKEAYVYGNKLYQTR
jgi:hypothetical protein